MRRSKRAPARTKRTSRLRTYVRELCTLGLSSMELLERLKGEAIIQTIENDRYIVVGRWGTNKANLIKVLKKYEVKEVDVNGGI